MKLVIADLEVVMKNKDYSGEKKMIAEYFPEIEIVDYIYSGNEEEFCQVIKDADALVTAFVKMDGRIMDHAPHLKIISVSATGYAIIDIKEATRRGIRVAYVKEYCVQEVAEHTMALMLMLQRQIKPYLKAVEEDRIWKVNRSSDLRRVEGQTMAIFGFGKIGQAVAKRAAAFGIRVFAVDPYLPQEIADKLGVTLVDADYALAYADIICNHMNQNEENINYFSEDKFEKMKRQPIFINCGRGACVSEEALAKALDHKTVLAAGLDVLADEQPNLKQCSLLGRDNVIITPHAAFYSAYSTALQKKITFENIIHHFMGEEDKIIAIAN